MAEENIDDVENSTDQETSLQGGAYEVLRKRLTGLNSTLCETLEQINVKRKEIFGGQESLILSSERIQTENNCTPRDIIGIGEELLFGYNVFLGLRSETKLSDVFSVYKFENNTFQARPLDIIDDKDFERDFKELYKYYKNVRFLQFIKNTGRLLMIFQIGESTDDIKIFRFDLNSDTLKYIDNRGDMDYKQPPQHDFEWSKAGFDDYVQGEHGHVNILDKVFVECIGGDLTIKIEDNTSTGEGIYAEPVENADQTLDDAEIHYAELGNLILLRMLPYRENAYRHFVYNTVNQTVARIDSIGHSCIQLPEDHGIIVPKGYYLQDGVTRQFDEDVENMKFLECIKSPNGEDFLYIFYNEDQGKHILIQYNLISKDIANPLVCHGYSLFDNGQMVLFSSPDEEPKRNHAMQIWQTPFYGDSFEVPQTSDSYLTKVGNRDLVRGISEGYSISRQITSETVNLAVYQQLIKTAQNMLDGYHWLQNEEVFSISKIIQEVKDAAIAAVDEYEKVQRIRENTKNQISENAQAVHKLLIESSPDSMTSIESFVKSLAEIRTRRGQVISLRELRYADMDKIDEMDKKLEEANENVATTCVDFLMLPESMESYINKDNDINADLDKCEKIADVKPLAEKVEELAEGLDLLTDIVNNLNIEDATKTTQIVDKITDVYAGLNRTRATVRNMRKSLGQAEAKAEFGAQHKLVSQSITNYIGMCDTVERCDEYLTKVMINLEELEGQFADYDEYVEQLIEKREEANNAFSGRKQTLDEEQKRKTTSLLSSAERILKGIINRAETFKAVDEINAYFASDLMVSKLRDIIKKLTTSGDTVKADDLNGRLKSAKDEVSRRLRDKLDLFEDGENVIKFGDFKFSVNTQDLELTTIFKDNEMFFHLTGTDYYEQIENPEFLETRELWQQELVSEDRNVTRSEYLAYKILQAAISNSNNLSIDLLAKCVRKDEGLLKIVQDFAASRYSEGYDKGIHDNDASLILTELVKLYNSCELLRYDSTSRAHAIIFWAFFDNEEVKVSLREKMRSYGALPRIFDYNDLKHEYVAEVREQLALFYQDLGREVPSAVLGHAAEFLYYELQDKEDLEFTINALAKALFKRFNDFLKNQKVLDAFKDDISKQISVKNRLNLIYDWVSTYVQTQEQVDSEHLIWEVIALIAAGDVIKQETSSISTYVQVEGLLSQHSLIQDKKLDIYFDRFLLKMKDFTDNQVPMFEKYTRMRTSLTEERRIDMRLSEFKPKVMGGFVRNKLINDVYLNLVGANFAKQMGVVGENKRTDLMGLLLLISPPGYGKTTLMEYISSRLGLTFMKINGPAIGHLVTSLDPAEAPNATAREELYKLNLSLEMGNNVMIYLDDIQHLNPEFLQKFISLCDAQRKIEGVYKGVTRTYDLRGKKVAVVMAGNPYTESGGKFQIPDMLANRADTYNLGDIGSSNSDAFDMSFIENTMTSNAVLSTVSSHSHEDIYKFTQIVERGSDEGIEFNYNYSAAEVNEITTVLKKLFMIRDTVLKVNQQYIYSAAQEDEYRTEPGFKLQGSYRNMNKMAEKVFPVMTDDEVQQVINDHYFNEAQTLTAGAESNVLKFKEMTETLTEQEAGRWENMKGEFNRRQTLSGVDDGDDLGKIVAQLSSFGAGIQQIKAALDSGVNGGIKELVSVIKDGGLSQQTDMSSVKEIAELMKSGGLSKPIDMAPLAEAISTMHAASSASEPEAVSAELLTRQAQAMEDIAKLVEEINGQSQTFASLKNLIHRLINGDLSIQFNGQ